MFSVERWAEVATPSRPFATQPQLRRSYKLRVSQSILGEKNTNLKTRTSGDIFYNLQALMRAPPQTERKSKTNSGHNNLEVLALSSDQRLTLAGPEQITPVTVT